MRSPIYLESKRHRLGRRTFATGRWCVRGELRIARFTHDYGHCVAVGILHPSTRVPGTWQFSTFDQHGPMGHQEGETPEKALRNGTELGYNDGWGGHRWRLRGIVLADGSTVGNMESPPFGCGDPECGPCAGMTAGRASTV